MIYKFQCCCDNSSIEKISRHVKTRLIKNVPKWLELYIKVKPKKMSIAVKNAISGIVNIWEKILIVENLNLKY